MAIQNISIASCYDCGDISCTAVARFDSILIKCFVKAVGFKEMLFQ